MRIEEFTKQISESWDEDVYEKMNRKRSQLCDDNIVIQQYALNKEDADELAGLYLKDNGVDYYYTWAQSKDDIDIVFGTGTDGYRLYFYLGYKNLKDHDTKATGAIVSPILDDTDGCDQMMASLIVLYAIARKMRYRELEKAIESLTSAQLLFMGINVNAII